MLPLEDIRTQIMEALPGAACEIVPNPGPSGQDSLLVDSASVLDVARFLRDDERHQFDYCSNASGVDWLDQKVSETVKVAGTDAEGQANEVEETLERVISGYLEAVYHLYSVALSVGPLVLRVRTGNRSEDVEIPSLTPLWRSCEFQEREIFDLYGIRFSGHPDLRRLLMWDTFEGHPMRKDYQAPDETLAFASANGKEDAS
jgi:NADH-quinone oxidoreductase subunit C